MRRDKSIACVLSLISVCSCLSKVDAVPRSKSADHNLKRLTTQWTTKNGVRCKLYDNNNLVVIVNDGKVKNIFADCEELKNRIKSVLFIGNIKSIGDYTFYKCQNLNSVTLPTN